VSGRAAIDVVNASLPGAEEALRAGYEQLGFCAVAPVIPHDLVERAASAMDRIVGGITPRPMGIVKIDQPHWTDETLREVVTHPELARWAAALVGASTLQVFAVQLLYKPTDAPGQEVRVGWHQDDTYWDQWWTGEAFTAWVALSEVTADSGPVRFVAGSHRWGNIGESDFFGRDDETAKSRFRLPDGAEWTEVAAELPPGGVSFHTRYTMHGSSSNTGPLPRRGLAVHLRSERAEPVPGLGYDAYRNADATSSPFVHGRPPQIG